MADAGGSGRLDLAIRRLERAVAQLDNRLSRRVAEAGAEVGGLFDLDRARLAQDLDASRARERALEAAATEARAAVDAAMAEVRRAMAERA
ncbi:MAG: DUF4164 family protein [Caulobacteraceae bacterium]|nr:DUF4164 family protein [Caulobacteraceae bacterium]